MRHNKIITFYKSEMSYIGGTNFSKSPSKPTLFLEHMKSKGLFKEIFSVKQKWNKFGNDDFKEVHTDKYVDNFFNGVSPDCESNGLKWNKEFSETVRYTNASLYEAIKNSINNPTELSFSPTSGFHHARPNGGGGFCTFAGQVIASLKVYDDFNKVGCYFDLDGHFGNSIEDCRGTKRLKKKLNKAIPKWANVNPVGDGMEYMNDFSEKLSYIKEKILNGKVDYVVWCHGADSHKLDMLHGQVNTKQWTACTRLFCKMIKEVDIERGVPIPVSIALFGGYRKKYDEVLELHEKDLTIIFKQLCNGY